MLDTFRRAQPAIIKTVLGAVVIAFVATIFLDWGWRRSDRPDTRVATVGGQALSLREFQMTYTNLTDFYRRVYQSRFDEDFARSLNLKQQALDMLIQRKLLLQEANRQGLAVTDAELVDHVQSYPAFQVDGTFDYNRYLQVLRMSRLTAGDFEQNQREELLLAKLENLIKDAVLATDSEVKQAFIQDKEQIDVEYVPIDPARFADQVEVSADEVSVYYTEHGAQFRTPEQLRIGYVIVDPAVMSEHVDVSDERLQQYYAEHKEDFHQEEQVHARHVLFKLAQQAGPEEEARVRSEAEAALKRIQAGEDFATVASQLSQDPASAPQGGDLGFFKRGEMVKAFEEVAFNLQPGMVSDPVRTDFGYHVIKVEAMQEAGYRPFEEVKADIRDRLVREETQRLAEAKAQRVHDAVEAAGNDWQAAVQEIELQPRETPFIARGAAVEGVDNPQAFSQAAFALHDGEISAPMLIGERYVVLKLLERQESHLPPLEEIHDRVRQAVIRERSQVLARQQAEEYLQQVEGGRSLAEVAETLHTPVEHTGYFSRNSTIPKLGRPAAFIRAAFRMKPGEVRMIDLPEQPALVVLKERKEFDPAAYEQEKAQVRQQLLRQKREQTFAQWSDDLHRQAEARREIAVNETVVAMFER